jgi:hypothetical protein
MGEARRHVLIHTFQPVRCEVYKQGRFASGSTARTGSSEFLKHRTRLMHYLVRRQSENGSECSHQLGRNCTQITRAADDTEHTRSLGEFGFLQDFGIYVRCAVVKILSLLRERAACPNADLSPMMHNAQLEWAVFINRNCRAHFEKCAAVD